MAKLTDKQRTFCEEYLVDLNGAQAAIRAGYSEDSARVIASQNLSKLNIQEYIQELQGNRSKSTAITAEYVLTSLQAVANRCMEEETYEHAGANKALELLGKHMALFTDRVQVEDNSVDIDKLQAAIDKLEQKGIDIDSLSE